jgi:glycosyltransferase involved in cell wall biosynthesis
MQIDHVTFSKTGGAGVVAQTIAKAQVGLGHDAKVLTVVDSDLRSQPLRKPAITLTAAADEWLASSRSKNSLFSPLRANLESLGHKEIRPDSIIHLHWITGVLNQKSLLTLLDAGRKAVWTLHDMNPFTGGCHHSHDCNEFLGDCSYCPQARPLFQKVVSINLSKKQLPKHYPNLRIVSPTSWMSEQAKLSSVFRDQDCSVIANPIDDAFFKQPTSLGSKEKLAIGARDFVSVVIAKDLKDQNKNLGFILQALELASFAVDRPLTLLMVGKNGGSFSSPLVSVRWLGELRAAQIAEVATAADCVLSASIAESAGMTIVECAAMGIPSIALENGGTASLISDGETGFLAKDMESFVRRVTELAKDNSLLAKFGQSAQLKARGHKPDQIANSYIDLYESMA